jgi:MFS family permease
MGQTYDIFGRRPIIIINYILLIICLYTVPMTAPSIPLLALNRIGLGVTGHFIGGNPTVPDSVKPASRGKAVTLQMFGTLIGELIAMTVLFKMTSDWEFQVSFSLVSIVVAFLAIVIFFTVKEPKIKLQRPEVRQQ